MPNALSPMDIVTASLGVFAHRQPFSPGMFASLKPLFTSLGLTSAAVYIVDDYPDHMRRTVSAGDGALFPEIIPLGGRKSPAETARTHLKGVKGLMLERLFSHDRELGVLAAACPRAGDKAEAFAVLAGTVSVMAYIEHIRTNSRRERQERDIFFGQSLVSRLMPRPPPKTQPLKTGVEFVRGLEPVGDFYDFIPLAGGDLIGFVGRCNDSGLRTVLEVMDIMHNVHRALIATDDLTDVLHRVNSFLVHERCRAHQSSLALFRIRPAEGLLELANAGRVGLILCGPDAAVRDISAPGAMYLGMMDDPEFHHGVHDFRPGQALIGVTEEVYAPGGPAAAGRHWFPAAILAAASSRRRKPLINAVFDPANRKRFLPAKHDESLLAVSVEFAVRNRDSVRLKQS